MDGSHFDTLARSLTTAGSHRRALGGLLLGSLGLLGWDRAEDAAAHDLKATCKKKSEQAKKKCRKKAKKHAAAHASEPPPRAPVAVPTYQCLGPRENNVVGGTATTRLAQSFTAGVSGSLHQIQIGVEEQAQHTADYLVELLDLDVDGKPTNTVLATATVPKAGIPPGPSTLTASFAGPPLVAGIEYAAAISRPGETIQPGFYVQTRSPDDCAGSGFRQDPSTGTSQFMPLEQDLLVSVIILV